MTIKLIVIFHVCEIRAICHVSIQKGFNIVNIKSNSEGIKIVDCHEHIQSIKQAEKAITVMDHIGIEKMALVGSPWFMITMNEKYGFARYDWNNNQLLEIMEKYQGRFEA